MTTHLALVRGGDGQALPIVPFLFPSLIGPQPPNEDIRNALQLLDGVAWLIKDEGLIPPDQDVIDALADAIALLETAVEKLEAPTPRSRSGKLARFLEWLAIALASRV